MSDLYDKGVRSVSVYTNRRGKIGVTMMLSEEFARALASDDLEAVQAVTEGLAKSLQEYDESDQG